MAILWCEVTMEVGHKRRSGDVAAVRGQGRRSGALTTNGLLRRVARGDAAAFAVVCDEVSSAVYGLVSRIIPDPGQAEQVAAEVLVDVWRSAPRFRPAENSGLSWIMTMARRHAVSRAAAVNAVLPAGIEPAGIGGAAERAAGSLLAHRDLAALPEPQRAAVLLAYCGYTGRQVAELAGVSAATVAEWLRDGLLGLSSQPD
jgi:RNA polymerase sigma-70 factor (ECF subfamily)